MNNLVILIINAFFYVLLFGIYQYKKRVFDLGSIVLFMWAILSIIAIHGYYNSHGWVPYRPVTVFPFLYLFASVFITAFPLFIYKAGSAKTYNLAYPNSFRMDLVSVGLIIISFVSLGVVFKDGFSFLSFFKAENILENYSGTEIEGNFLYLISSTLSFMLPVFLMYNVVQRKKLLVLLLFISLSCPLILAIHTSSRYYILKFFFSVLYALVIFWSELSKKQKRIILSASIIPVTLLVIGIVIITVTRFSSAKSGILSITEFYLVNGIIYFNGYGLDAGGIRYGDGNFTRLKQLLGLDWVSKADLSSKYAGLDIDNSLFTTFVGEFTLDLGYCAIIFFMLLSLSVSIIVRPRHKKIPFYSVLALSVPFQMLAMGFSLNVVTELYVIFLVLLYLFLYVGVGKK